MRSRSVLSIVLVAAATQPLSAQRRVQVTPFLASYYSARELGNYVAPPDSAGLTYQFLQNNSPAIGVSAALMLSDVFGVEASGAYAFSAGRFQGCDQTAPVVCSFLDLSGSLTMLSLAGRYRPRRSNFEMVAGLSMDMRGGDLWAGRESNTSLGVLFGAGVIAQVTPKLPLNVRGELHVYSFDPDESAPDWDSAMALDFLFKLGIPLGGRR